MSGDGYYVTVYDKSSGNFRSVTYPVEDLNVVRRAAGKLEAEGRIVEIDRMEDGVWGHTVEKLHDIPSNRL